MLTLSGCFDKKETIIKDKPTIYTTVYPVEYIVDYLYKDYADIQSIYPTDADVDKYTLTPKQLKDYSLGNYFIYNGLTNEKQIAKSLINNNNAIQLIDVSYDLNYNYGVEELWLSPNNFLMLTKNVKNNLINSIPEKFEQIKSIESKYKELEEILSLLDAELRNTANNAKSAGNNKILAASYVFKYLEKYGFEVATLENVKVDSKEYNDIKKNNYKFILTKDADEQNETVKKIVAEKNLNIARVNSMHTLSNENIENNEDYISIMNKYINELDKLVNG